MTCESNHTILWIHGWAGSPTVWQPLQDQLPGRHRTLAFQDVTTAAGFPEAVAEAIRRHRPEWLVGWSMGGILALQLAATAPWQELRGVLTVSATPCFVSDNRDRGWPRAALTALARRLQKQPEGILRRFQEQMFAPSETDLQKRYLDDFGGWPPDDFPMPALLAGLAYLKQTDLRSALPQISCPVLWLHGELDKVCPIGCLDLIPPAHLSYIVPKAGHLPFLRDQRTTANQLHRLFDHAQA